MNRGCSSNPTQAGVVLLLTLGLIGAAYAAENPEKSCTLKISAQGLNGPAEGLVWVERKRGRQKPDTRAWRKVAKSELTAGECTLRLAPGDYRLTFHVNGSQTLPENFTLEQNETRTFSFGVARLEINSRTYAGPSRWAEIWLEDQTDASKSTSQPAHWRWTGMRELKQGTYATDLVAGEYRLKYCTGTLWTEPEQLTFTSGQKSALVYYVPAIEVAVSRPADTGAGGRVIIEWERPDPPATDQPWMRVAARPVGQKLLLKWLLPGRYRVRFEGADTNVVSEPFRLTWMAGVRVSFDRATATFKREFMPITKANIPDVLRLFAPGACSPPQELESWSPDEAISLLDSARAGFDTPADLTDEQLATMIAATTPNASKEAQDRQRAAIRYLQATTPTEHTARRQVLYDLLADRN
ncbi:MAG: hypothetical protein ABIG44_19145 [Planctomycetota bacterium]